MTTIASQLIQLNQIKTDILNAILGKNVIIDETTPFIIYANKVSEIKNGNRILALSGGLVVSQNGNVSGYVPNVSANDYIYEIISPATHGTASIINNKISYVPELNYSGSDEFSVRVTDSSGFTTTAAIPVTVTWVDQAPVAVDGSGVVNSNGQLKGTLSASDIDTPGMIFSIVSDGTKGTAIITNATTGAFTYTPQRFVSGVDTFTFKANDGTSDSNVATYTIDITMIETAPTTPTGFRTSTIGADIITFIWDACVDPESDSVIYYLYKDGIKVVEVSTLTYTVTGETPNTTHEWQISAFDGYLESPKSSSISVTTTAIDPATKLEYPTVLMLHGDGLNGSTMIWDSTTANHTMTAFGTATLSTTKSKLGGTSMFFDGTSYISTPSSVDWDFGTTDFTIDCWLNATEYKSRNHIFGNMSDASLAGGMLMEIGSDQAPSFNINGVAYSFGSSPLEFSTGMWHHVALTRISDILTLFVDGMSVGSVSCPANIISTNPLYIAQAYPNSEWRFNGYIDEFRIITGVAKWTANFNPEFMDAVFAFDGEGPTVVDLMPFEIPTLRGAIQTSADAFVYGTQSIKFNGSDSYIDLQNVDAIVLADNDFTFEAWVKTNTVMAKQGICSLGGNSNNSSYAALEIEIYQGRFYVSIGKTGSSWAISQPTGPVLLANTWYHIAVTRKGYTITTYINGVPYVNGSVSGSLYLGTAHRIGALKYSSPMPLNGYMDNIGLVMEAKYTGPFTP